MDVGDDQQVDRVAELPGDDHALDPDQLAQINRPGPGNRGRGQVMTTRAVIGSGDTDLPTNQRGEDRHERTERYHDGKSSKLRQVEPDQ
jgi:hypothetical protein